mmetsp:Transcript_28845/g.51375  ORF Transcript_28845/g.51375 Transcript_28845/m.51375 type:complete len:642 (-) Transcript_28845:138-2063(-)
MSEGEKTEAKELKGRDKYLDPEYKGEKLPDDLKDGPIENRRCTDILFLFIFIAFLVTWFIVGITGFATGDPSLLTYPIDSEGNQCGLPDGDAEDYKYLYFPFPLPDYLDYRVCVDSCPEDWDEEVDCLTNNKIPDCEFRLEDIVDEPHPLFGYIQGIYPSDGYLKKFCLPNSESVGWLLKAYDNVFDEIDKTTASEWIGDIVTVWPIMVAVAGIAVVVAAIYLLIMRMCVGVIVWVCIFATFAILVALGGFTYWTANNVYDSDEDDSTQTTLKVLAYICWGISGLFILYIFCMCNRIRLAIAIMKTGTIYIKDVWHILFVPPVFFIVTLGIYIYWILACLFIYSSGDIKDDDDGDAIAEVEFDAKTRRAFWFEFFGILWVNAFIIAVEQFVLASTVCIWYFSQGSDAGVQRPISRSLYRAFRYHLGSLAFGSFILAVVQAIKWILLYIRNRVAAAGGEHSKIVKCLLNCLICYVNCFERFVKFLNKNAYIQIALHGTTFCTAAADAFFLILRNAGRFFTLGMIGGVFLFLGRWSVALLSAWFGYMIISRAYEDDLHSPVFPTVVFFLIAYAIALLFMSVYSMACDAILHCFLADEELSGEGRQAVHAPELLRDFMSNERKRQAENEGKQKTSKGCGCCCSS